MSTPASAAPASPEASRSAAIVLLIACGATFMAFLDATVVNVAFPALQDSFPDDSVATLSWVVSSYGVFFAALLTPAGRIADVIGRRDAFLWSVGLFALGSGICAAAPNVGWLIGARALQGAGAAGMIPAALGLLLAELPAEKRIPSIGIWAAVGSLAAAAGPSLGGLLVDWTGWRSVFLINVPVGLAVIWAGLALVPRRKTTGRQLPDAIGTVALTAGLGIVVVGLTKGTDWGWSSVSTLGTIIGGALLALVALARSRRHPAPVIELELWQSRTFALANLGSLLGGGALFAWLLSGPLFLTTYWHYSVLKAGFAVTPGALTSAIAALYVGRRTKPKHQRASITIGMLVFAAVGFWMAAALDEQHQFLAVWLPAGMLGGAAFGATNTGLTTAAAMSLPPMRFAAGTGMQTTARQLGGAIGVAVMASIAAAMGMQDPDAMRVVFAMCGGLGLAAAIVGLWLLDRSKPAPAAQAAAPVQAAKN